MDRLALARRSQYAALIRDEGVLVVWADSVDSLIPTTDALEHSLIQLVRSGRGHARSPPSSNSVSASQLETPLPVPEPSADPEKALAVSGYAPRQLAMVSPITSGIAVMVLMILIGLGVSECSSRAKLILGDLLVRFVYDKDASRFALVFTFIPAMMLAAFPAQVLVGNLVSLFSDKANTR
jgi:hypothetical protein